MPAQFENMVAYGPKLLLTVVIVLTTVTMVTTVCTDGGLSRKVGAMGAVARGSKWLWIMQ